MSYFYIQIFLINTSLLLYLKVSYLSVELEPLQIRVKLPYRTNSLKLSSYGSNGSKKLKTWFCLFLLQINSVRIWFKHPKVGRNLVRFPCFLDIESFGLVHFLPLLECIVPHYRTRIDPSPSQITPEPTTWRFPSVVQFGKYKSDPQRFSFSTNQTLLTTSDPF